MPAVLDLLPGTASAARPSSTPGSSGAGWSPFAFQREVWAAYLRRRERPDPRRHRHRQDLRRLDWPSPRMAGDPRARPPSTPAAGGPRRRRCASLWLTPLRALAADTEAALRAPLAELGIPWTLERRTGDTSASVRDRQREKLPTALVTTPESLSLLLSRADARELFAELRLVVVDEWHELLGNKRGAQTELALARLRRFQPALRTWGLSATLGNLDVARAALLGVRRDGPAGASARRPKEIRVDALIPETIERFPWAGHLGLKLLPQVIAAIEEGRTALVFTNTRSQTEIWYQAILDARPDWAGEIALHHGSLDRKVRDFVEAACAPAACAAWSAPRASTSASTSRRSTGCSRSAARRGSPASPSGPAAAATGPARRAG